MPDMIGWDRPGDLEEKRDMETIQVVATVRVPKVPNFLLMDNDQKLPLSAFTEDGLRELGKAWTDNLLKRAKEQREPKEAGPD